MAGYTAGDHLHRAGSLRDKYPLGRRRSGGDPAQSRGGQQQARWPVCLLFVLVGALIFAPYLVLGLVFSVSVCQKTIPCSSLASERHAELSVRSSLRAACCLSPIRMGFRLANGLSVLFGAGIARMSILCVGRLRPTPRLRIARLTFLCLFVSCNGETFDTM